VLPPEKALRKECFKIGLAAKYLVGECEWKIIVYRATSASEFTGKWGIQMGKISTVRGHSFPAPNVKSVMKFTLDSIN
jgi:hypothetical protein